MIWLSDQDTIYRYLSLTCCSLRACQSQEYRPGGTEPVVLSTPTKAAVQAFVQAHTIHEILHPTARDCTKVSRHCFGALMPARCYMKSA